MHAALRNLLDVLALVPAGDGVWRARSLGDMGDRLFGGQVLAQALVAAQRATGAGLAHSLHACFLRRGTPHQPIELAVETLRRSRTFVTCRVTAKQERGAILEMLVSYHEQEPGPMHQIPMDDVGEPEGESYERAMLQVMTPQGFEGDDLPFELPVEIRGVGGLFDTEVKPPRARCWMRMRDALPDDPVLHQCLFAYASDYAIMAPALNPHPVPVTAMQSASLDHAIWFHRAFRIDEWLLLEGDSPVANDARGIGRGLLYTRDGTLVASCVQEGLLRPLPTASGAQRGRV
jgi:acyl-CoA thioesterase-2